MIGICFRCLPWRQFQLTFKNEWSDSFRKTTSGCLQGRGHILAVFSGGLFPRGKDMYLFSVTRAKVDGICSKECRGLVTQVLPPPNPPPHPSLLFQDVFVRMCSSSASIKLVLTITKLTTFYYSCNDRMFAFESRKELFAIWPKQEDLSV